MKKVPVFPTSALGPSVTLGPVGPGGTLSQCNPDQPVADGPVGSFDELGLVGPRGMFLQMDIKKVATTDELANSVGTSPSSDSGIHSLGEQWEDTSVVTTDTEDEQNRMSRIYTPTERRMIDTCVPNNTEEDDVTLSPLIDCGLNPGGGGGTRDINWWGCALAHQKRGVLGAGTAQKGGS